MVVYEVYEHETITTETVHRKCTGVNISHGSMGHFFLFFFLRLSSRWHAAGNNDDTAPGNFTSVSHLCCIAHKTKTNNP